MVKKAYFKVDAVLSDKDGNDVAVTQESIQTIKTDRQALPVQHKFMNPNIAEYQQLITAQSAVDSRTLIMATAIVGWIGAEINLMEGPYLTQYKILNVVGSTVTLDGPLDFPYSVNAYVDIGTTNMAVNGLVTPQVFRIKPPPGQVWIMNVFLFAMLTPNKMDDGKFGHIAALTNGVFFRKGDGVKKVTANVKKNLDFFLISSDGFYTQPSGVAPYGLHGKDYFGEQGAAFPLYGDAGDTAEVVIQDDLSAITSFEFLGKGYLLSYVP